MPAASQGRIRESWQPGRLEGTRARVWLIVRRTIATLVALTLVGVCGYLLFALLWRPQTYLVHLTATTYRPHLGQPLQFAFGDFQAMQRLKDVVAGNSIGAAPGVPLTKDAVEDRLAEISRLHTRGKDTLIVYLAAHGVMSDGEPSLLCEQEGNWNVEDRPEVVSITSVLAALKNAKSGTKLLILDAGQDSPGERRGLAINTFPAALQRTVDELGDATLWVLSANAPLERSHVSPHRGRSVFGHFVSEGLTGAADSNEDETVTLDELYAYVQSNVSAWVELVSDGNETQTPLLLNSQLRDSAPAIALLSIANLSVPDESSGDEAAGLVDATALSEAAKEAAGEAAEEAMPEGADVVAERLSEQASNETGDGGDSAKAATDSNRSPLESSAGQARRIARKTATGRQGAQQALQKAWQAAEALESAHDSRSPSVYAPFLWRKQLDRLLWYEQCCAADLPKEAGAWKDIAVGVNRVYQSLDALVQNDAAGVVDDQVERLLDYAPRVPVDVVSAEYGSFAMVELISQRDPSRPLDKKLKDFAQKYDELIRKTGGNRSELTTLYGNGEQPSLIDLKKYYEFQLIDVVADGDIPWDLAQLALRVRRLGEQAAANPFCGEGWCVEEINAADVLRLEGERHILDQTSDAWIDESKARLGDAEAKYQQIVKDLQLVDRATQKRNALARRLPDVCRLAHAGQSNQLTSDRKTAAVNNVISGLDEVSEVLAAPGSESIANLNDSLQALQQASDEVEKELEQSTTAWQKSLLLATTLPEPGERLQLRTDVQTLEDELSEEFDAVDKEPSVLNVPSPTELQASQLARQLALEIASARIARRDGELVATLEKIKESLESKAEGWDVFDDARAALDAAHQSLPASIAAISTHRELRETPARTENHLPALRGAIQSWLSFVAVQPDQIDPDVSSLVEILNDAAWYDLLVWHGDRYRRAAEDSPEMEATFLQNAANECRQLAQQIPRQPELALPSAPDVSIQDAPTEISLQQQDEVSLPFSIVANGAEKVWLVVQCNDRLLQVEGRGIASQEELRQRADAARHASGSMATTGYPYRPNLIGIGETIASAAGRTPVRLTVRRLGNAKGKTKLILKAISPQSYVRHEVDVVLPSREQFEFLVGADQNFWGRTDDGVDLRPLPNRTAPYAFGISNLTRVAKKLEVCFWMPSRIPSEVNGVLMPSGTVARKNAQPFIDAFGLRQLGPRLPLELPASSDPVRIKLSAANPMDQPKPDANLLVTNGAAPENFIGVPLPYGLYVSFEDQENVTYRRIDVSPQRPRMYLQAVAQFNRDTGRLEIQVEAPNTSILPADGLQVTADFGPGWAQQITHDDTAVLTPANNSAILHAIYVPNGPQEIRACVHVDGYPRAFIFRLSRNTSEFDIQPTLAEREVHIKGPAPGATFGKTRFVPATVEVDGPENSILEVGIDQQHDGFLDRDPKTLRKSDRQVVVLATSLTPDGTLTLYPRVSDFEIDVPTGDDNLQANLLARLVTSGQPDAWSEGVPIVLDSAGPALQVALRPGRRVELETEIEVLVSTSEPELSGIQTVDAVIEPSAAPTADKEKKPWEPGKPSEDGRWIVRLKTDKLERGPHTVLVRATDKVGNSSEAIPEIVDIVPKRIQRELSEEEKKAQQANTVSGRLLYGGKPIDDADVSLEPSPPEAGPVKTDANGDFNFAKVPPGTYTVKARGMANGGWRRAQAQIEVQPRGKPPTVVKLNAETAFRQRP